MADCTDYPTPEDAKRFKNNANSVNEFVTSDSDTFVDQDGGEHITIRGIDTLAETQRDQFDATFQAQFTYKHIGNISDYVGDSLSESEKLNSYQYPDDSGEWYGPIQSQTFPVTIPTDPTVDEGWVLTSNVSKQWVAETVSNTNLLSNHNFLIKSPDNITQPSATPTDYTSGTQVFSGIFVGEDIVGLTYIDGRVSWDSGTLYFSVPNTGGLEYVDESDFVASVADFDGKPRTRGVSFALVGDQYRVTVGVDALEDESANATPLGSVKFEQGSVATGHEVGENPIEVSNSGNSQLAGGLILPVENHSALDGDNLTGASFIKLQGGDFTSLTQFPVIKKDGTKTAISGVLSNVNLTTKPYSATVGSDDVWLLDIKYYLLPSNGIFVDAFWAVGDDTTDDILAISTAESYCTSINVNTLFSSKKYRTTAPIVPTSGACLLGVQTTRTSPGTIIRNDDSGIVVTDFNVQGFSGLTVKNISASGGAQDQYAIQSHLPNTTIENFYIEDGTSVDDAYKGNGIRLHNDGGQSGMGAWGSRIINPKITLTWQEETRQKVCISLYINGGDVEIDTPTLLHCNIAVQVWRCEHLTINKPSIAIVKDNVTTSDSFIGSAAIVLGSTSTPFDITGFDVECLDVRGGYIEGYSRILLANNAANISFKGTYFHDIAAFDPTSTAINDDGAFYMGTNASGLNIDGCFIKCSYGQQRMFWQKVHPAGCLGVTVENTSFSYLNHRPHGVVDFAGGFGDYYLNNFNRTYTESDGTTRVTDLYVRSPAVKQAQPTVDFNVWYPIGQILDGETWWIEAYSASEGVSQVAFAYAFQNQGSGMITNIQAATAIEFRVDSGNIEVRQTNQFSNPISVRWKLRRISKSTNV